MTPIPVSLSFLLATKSHTLISLFIFIYGEVQCMYVWTGVMLVDVQINVNNNVDDSKGLFYAYFYTIAV